MSLSAGARLGPYEIVSTLGRGGMGEVYKARDSRLNRFVALKVLPDTAALDPERRDRFEREARAIAALNHPHIVTIHSVETVDGVPLLTMELVEGRALSDVIPKGGLPLAEVLKIAIAVADAVAAAHQKGITHRDLKPGNIMVGEREHDGRIKVLDFGLAKLADASREGSGATTMPAAPATGEGRILGTAAYMSPEQAEGRPVDARSDLFSLGVMLYEMATGQRPFTGDTSISIISSIVKDTPKPITELNPSLPRDLGRIVRRALAKDPERRYQSAKDLRNDLEELKASIDSGELIGSARRDGSTGPPARARVCASSRLVVGRCCCRGGPRHCGGVAVAAVTAAGAHCAIGDRVAGRRQPGSRTSSWSAGDLARWDDRGADVRKRTEDLPRAPPPGFRYVSTSAGHRRRQAGVLVAGQPSHRILCGHHAEASSARWR